MKCWLAATTGIVAISLTGLARAAWPFQAGDYIYVSPSIADINGDSTLEIVFASWDGNCYCLDIDGNELWATSLHEGNGFPPQLASSPAFADLDEDPATLETVIGSGEGSAWGRLYCLSSNGSLLATFETPTTVRGSPLITDLEGNGTLQIVFGHHKFSSTPPAFLICLDVVNDKNGLQLVERWRKSYLTGTINDAPAAVDINGDGVLEIVVSIGNSNNAAVFCLDHEGEYIWSFQIPDMSFYNTPAVHDGKVHVAPYHDDTRCLDALTGDELWTFPDPGDSMLHSPSVADLNGDGPREVVVGCYGIDTLFGITPDGQQAWQHSLRPEWASYSSPGIADVDGDGDLEIAIGTGTPPELGTSSMYLFDHEGNVVWQKIMPSAVYSSPALADLDGDGFLEIAFGCYDHKFYVLDYQGNTFVPNPNTKPKDLAPWPTYRQNNQRTGFYPGPPTTPPIPGDITGDGSVDVDDLLAVINSWGECPPACPPDIAPAPKGNGDVDVDDLLQVINNWG